MSDRKAQSRGNLMTMLKRHRMAKGLTLREVAQRIGVSLAAVSTWETGRCIPSASLIPKLARLYGVDPLALMEMIVPQHRESMKAAVA